VVARLDELAHQVRSQEPRPAGHAHLHERNSLRRSLFLPTYTP
jgi:hypothetical protein